MSDVIKLRKNINNLTNDELKKLRSAYSKAMKLNDNRGFAHFAGFHGYPNWNCWHGPQSKDGWPGVRLFFPWHRAYLYTFERALQDLEPGVTIPWWDWRASNAAQNIVPKAFSDKIVITQQTSEEVTVFYDMLKNPTSANVLKIVFSILKSPNQEPFIKILNKLSQTLKDPSTLDQFSKMLTEPTQVETLKKFSNATIIQKIPKEFQLVIIKFCNLLKKNQDPFKKILDSLQKTSISKMPNPLYSFRMKFPERNIDRDTRRFPGKTLGSPVSLPSPADIDALLKIPDSHFDDFSDAAEDTHGLIHVWTGGEIREDNKRVSGDMGSIAFAAYDPIFWSHHCTIDRLWWMWQKKNGIDEIPKHYKKMALEPFGMTVEEVLDIYDLGYDYAGTETAVNGNWSGPSGVIQNG